jgi:hypothetical protein
MLKILLWHVAVTVITKILVAIVSCHSLWSTKESFTIVPVTVEIFSVISVLRPVVP